MESSIGEMLISGVKLMLIGMGIVYTFLMLLVWVIQQTHKIVHRLEPQTLPAPTEAAPTTTEQSPDDSVIIAAAVTAAIHRYEQERRQVEESCHA